MGVFEPNGAGTAGKCSTADARGRPVGRVKSSEGEGADRGFSACPDAIIVIHIARVYVSNTSTNVSHAIACWCRLNAAEHSECREPNWCDFKGLALSA